MFRFHNEQKKKNTLNDTKRKIKEIPLLKTSIFPKKPNNQIQWLLFPPFSQEPNGSFVKNFQRSTKSNQNRSILVHEIEEERSKPENKERP